ncbi:MAG: hypothetical protein JWO86_2876 [Myxococcaceae bacterium]|nr:hypothetical protein [Myxococcaceae bacterium]
MRSSPFTVLAMLVAVGVVVAAPLPARAQTAGINMGAPVYDGVVATDAVTAVIGTGAAHVRVNFRLDQWKSPTDPSKVNGKTFFEAYDGIIDAITSQGIEVYGLLNDELVSSGAPGTTELEDSYAANVLAVVDRYKDRVRVWETINEPNNYSPGTQLSRFSAAAFARAHARAYDVVKMQHPGDACWDVKMVTGPLFSFDGTSASDYFDATIAAGRAGGTWKAIRDALGHDPIDDVGYHLYVAQGPDSAAPEVAASAGANLAAMNGVLAKYGIAGKKFWISEIGFRLPLFDQAGQAARLDTTFEALGAPSRSDIASIQWFTIADFGGEGWGLYGASFAAKDQRLSHARFVAQAKAFAPALAARLEVVVPKQALPGSKVLAKVKATNLGKTTWNTASGIRLGAASGCPSAWSVNDATWSPATSDGYATSPTDARRFLPPSSSVAQGDSVMLEVPVVMPLLPASSQHFAVRMVQEGVAWFGATASADIEVTDAADGGPGFAGDGDAGGVTDGGAGDADGSGGIAQNGATEGSASGCGCRSATGSIPAGGAGARGVLFGAGMVALALWMRRRGARPDASPERRRAVHWRSKRRQVGASQIMGSEPKASQR